MTQVDRRAWLKLIGLATAETVVARPLYAKAARTGAPPTSGTAQVRLSLNENPYGPAPSAVAAVRRELTHLCRYTDVEASRLVSLIAVKEGVPEEQVILGEILDPLGAYLSLQGGPGGEFIYSNPGYTELIDAAATVGGTGVPVPLNSEMQNDLPAIAAKVNQRTRAVFLVNPHNPTGTVADANEFRQFVREASSRTLVIVDEAYLEFADGFAQRTLADRVRAGDDVIVFRTFAKMYGLAGLDIGYGLVPRHIAQALKDRGLNNPHLFNRLAVAAAAASLADTQYVSAVAARVAHEREIWLALLRDLKARVTHSHGNFIFFETGIPHADFAATLRHDGIDIGRSFPPYDRWARISIGLPQENALARAAVRKLLMNRSQLA
jgi:histidinol-phosphate aminotransferase